MQFSCGAVMFSTESFSDTSAEPEGEDSADLNSASVGSLWCLEPSPLSPGVPTRLVLLLTGREGRRTAGVPGKESPVQG